MGLPTLKNKRDNKTDKDDNGGTHCRPKDVELLFQTAGKDVGVQCAVRTRDADRGGRHIVDFASTESHGGRKQGLQHTTCSTRATAPRDNVVTAVYVCFYFCET